MKTPESEFYRPAVSARQGDLAIQHSRRFSRSWLVPALTFLLVVTVGAVWAAAQRGSIQKIGSTAAEPAYIVVNTPTQVTFTARITDRQLKKRSVVLLRLDASGHTTDILGRLNDDGRNGDARAGDGYYTLRTSLTEPHIGPVAFQVAARFKPGPWREPEPDDDDWDKELADLSRDRANRNSHLPGLFQRLGRYELSAIFQVTVDPFSLPPDPGEAGKTTLEGIDSDIDGVRDDVQRWIALTHTDSQKMQLALRQGAVALQDTLMAQDASSAEKASREESASARCIGYVTDASVSIDNLAHMMLNTDSRRAAYEAYLKLFNGPSDPIDLSKLKLFCQFDPDSLRN